MDSAVNYPTVLINTHNTKSYLVKPCLSSFTSGITLGAGNARSCAPNSCEPHTNTPFVNQQLSGGAPEDTVFFIRDPEGFGRVASGLN
jgi:hypothetical protein